MRLCGEKVRFPHSLMQAYLGSRLLDVALADPGYGPDALAFPRPSREFLIALVLRSRARGAVGSPDSSRESGGPGSRDGGQAGSAIGRELLAPLRAAAAARDDNKVLDMYSAAIEIDCAGGSPA